MGFPIESGGEKKNRQGFMLPINSKFLFSKRYFECHKLSCRSQKCSVLVILICCYSTVVSEIPGKNVDDDIMVDKGSPFWKVSLVYPVT